MQRPSHVPTLAHPGMGVPPRAHLPEHAPDLLVRVLSIAELPVFPGNVGIHYAKHQLDRVHIRTVGGHKEHFDAVRPTNSCQKVVGGMVDPGIVEEQHAIGHGEGMHDWNEVAPQEVHQRLEVPVAPEDLHRTEAV